MVISRISFLFPLLAVVTAIVAYVWPEVFAPYRGGIVPLLVIIMFSMGLTLKPEDFRRVLTRPKSIGLGMLLQYGIMPLAAFVIGYALDMPGELIAGMVLLGASPGGTASNVMAFLARADVALSVSMTIVSTLLAVLATPALTWLLIGRTVPVDASGMLFSLAQIVLLPIALGVLINRYFERFLAPVKVALPAIACAAILVGIAIVVALNRDSLATAGLMILVAVILHNGCGLVCGFWIPRLLGFDQKTCRTLSCEVGMQNSGLSVALAVIYFSPLSALPGALFSIWHIVSGALLAGFWSARRNAEEVPESPYHSP